MKTSLALSVLTLFLGLSFASAQGVNEFFEKSDSFFKTFIKEGKVDYKGIKANPESLIELLSIAEGISINQSDAMTYQAFWINGYNLLVIKGIVDHYPVQSPLDIKGFFDKTKRDIGGKQITLNDIENKLLRGNFPKEARFHFVLVCAGLGCPPIINEAYLPNNLETQLQTQTERALNDSDFIKVKGKKVLLSQIFEWYKSDFTQNGASEIDFINRYRNERFDSKSKIGYYPYDWTLNESK